MYAADIGYFPAVAHVLIFVRDRNRGRLTLLDTIDAPGVGLTDLSTIAVSADSAHVYVAGDSDNSTRHRAQVFGFTRDPTTGRLTQRTRLDQAEQPLAFIGALAPHRDGSLLIAGEGVDAGDMLVGVLIRFARTSPDAELAAGAAVPDAGGRVATGLVVSPDGSRAYTVHHGAVSALGIDTTSGALRLLAVAREGEQGVAGLSDADAVAASPDGAFIAVSPDGIAVYTTGARDSSLTVLSRQRDSGRLRWYEAHRDGSGADGLAGAAAVVVSPDGEWVHVAGSNDSAIATFHVDGSPILRDGAACEYDEDCASGGCDFLLRAPGEGGGLVRFFPSLLPTALRARGGVRHERCCQPRFPM